MLSCYLSEGHCESWWVWLCLSPGGIFGPSRFPGRVGVCGVSMCPFFALIGSWAYALDRRGGLCLAGSVPWSSLDCLWRSAHVRGLGMRKTSWHHAHCGGDDDSGRGFSVFRDVKGATRGPLPQRPSRYVFWGGGNSHLHMIIPLASLQVYKRLDGRESILDSMQARMDGTALALSRYRSPHLSCITAVRPSTSNKPHKPTTT